MKPSPTRRPFTWGFALALCVGLAPLAPTAANGEPVDGETIEVRGVVADAQGRPLPGLEISLIAEPAKLDWHRLIRRVKPPQTVNGTSDERGEFRLSWIVDAALPRLRVEARRASAVVASADITHRTQAGAAAPVIVSLAAAELPPAAGQESFRASLATEAERATYDRLGRPDRLDRLEGAGWIESAWWYFELGKVIRFRDGNLVETQAFTPIRPL